MEKVISGSEQLEFPPDAPQLFRKFQAIPEDLVDPIFPTVIELPQGDNAVLFR